MPGRRENNVYNSPEAAVANFTLTQQHLPMAHALTTEYSTLCAVNFMQMLQYLPFHYTSDYTTTINSRWINVFSFSWLEISS